MKGYEGMKHGFPLSYSCSKRLIVYCLETCFQLQRWKYHSSWACLPEQIQPLGCWTWHLWQGGAQNLKMYSLIVICWVAQTRAFETPPVEEESSAVRQCPNIVSNKSEWLPQHLLVMSRCVLPSVQKRSWAKIKKK